MGFRKKAALLAALFAFAALPSFSQTGGLTPSGGFFTPFVSRLNAEVSGKTVRLQWTDSPSLKGPVYVFRSRVPFVDGTQYQARSLEVPYGQQIFVEEVEALGMWYYFVSASDESRNRYDVIVPNNNIVDVQLDGSSKRVPASPGVASAGANTAAANRGIISQPAQSAAEDPTWTSMYSSYGVARQSGYSQYSHDIVDIIAQTTPIGVNITYRSSEPNKNALIYRSTRPFSNYNDLLSASLIKDHATSPYLDYPPPGYSYYYAVLYEEDIRSGQAAIYPGGNATVSPAQFGGMGTGASASSGAPAYTPYSPTSVQPNTYAAPDGGYFSTVRAPTPLTPESLAATEYIKSQPEIAPVLPKSSYGINMEPRVFNLDIQITATSGEDYDLSLIVRGPFMRKDWLTAGNELLRFLTASHSQHTAARARFYLGQCYYFLNDTQRALNEFLAVNALYPEEASGWVQASLSKLGSTR